MPYTHNKELVSYAKQLRKEMTSEERKLWYTFLRSYPVRFYRQRIIGNYIVDFYCPNAKLAIELDGSQHYDPQHAEYDHSRTEYLHSIGISVVRFPNCEINNQFQAVCHFIDSIVRKNQK